MSTSGHFSEKILRVIVLYVNTAKIAEKYPVAVKNAKKTVKRFLDEGMPGLEDTDARNQWLYRKCLTFSNVYEAIEFLENLEKK